MTTERKLEDGQSRCFGEGCVQRMRFLRFTERASSALGFPWTERFCDLGREHEGFIAVTVIRRPQ